MNSKISCDIILDLIELYHDGAVSDTTRKAVEEHLSECEGCKKEYEKIKTFLPIESESTTGDEFKRLMKAKKIKHRLTTAVCCVLACFMLAGSYSFLTQAYIKKMDLQVPIVYRYTTPDNEDKFFLITATPTLSGSAPKDELTDENGKVIYKYDRVGPIIGKNPLDGELHCDIEVFEAQNCDELVVDGNVVWTREKNADDKIPPYVYAYEDFESGNNDEFGDSDSISVGTSIDINDKTGEINRENSNITVHYPDKRLTWNLKGELIEQINKDVKKNSKN